MIFHENRLLADDSHEISYLIFFRKLGKRSKNLSSVAVVIGPLRVKFNILFNSLPTTVVLSADNLCKQFGQFRSPHKTIF